MQLRGLEPVGWVVLHHSVTGARSAALPWGVTPGRTTLPKGTPPGALLRGRFAWGRPGDWVWEAPNCPSSPHSPRFLPALPPKSSKQHCMGRGIKLSRSELLSLRVQGCKMGPRGLVCSQGLRGVTGIPSLSQALFSMQMPPVGGAEEASNSFIGASLPEHEGPDRPSQLPPTSLWLCPFCQCPPPQPWPLRFGWRLLRRPRLGPGGSGQG